MKPYLIILLAGLLWSCCKVQPPQGSVEVFPKKVSPGELLVIQHLESKTGKNLEVLFDKKGAPLIGSLDSLGLRVMVPELPVGKIKLHVLESGREISTLEVEILPSRASQLILQMDANGKITTLANKPYSGGFDQGFAHASRQLSYDIVNDKGQVLFSASVVYPATERKEVFEKPEGDNMRQATDTALNIVFPIKIPNLEGATAIRFYDAGGDDLSQSAARANRKLMQEIRIR